MADDHDRLGEPKIEHVDMNTWLCCGKQTQTNMTKEDDGWPN